MKRQSPRHSAAASTKGHWKSVPDEHDYPAATDYLSLITTTEVAEGLVHSLRSVPLVWRKAKDLLRASGLPHLPIDNVHVAKDFAKVKAGRKLSPVLLVRGDLSTGAPLIIADGYHRICASYLVDENAEIPCRIVDAR
jgi:hypothetical protein